MSKEDKLPLPGVNILVKGTRNGTLTSENGTFTLNVIDPNSILEISSIGYVTQEIPLNGQ